jgi:hypothetical protein
MLILWCRHSLASQQDRARERKIFNYDRPKKQKAKPKTFFRLILFYCSSYPYPTKWGRYNMFSSCCDKDSAIIFTTGRLTSTLLETGVDATTANAARTNSLTCLPKHRGARDNKFWSPILRLAIETGA